MRDLANKLMMRDQQSSTVLPSVIFGSTGDMLQQMELDRPKLRVGFWPIQSETEPEAAMGLAAVLAYLLERWQDVRVYRLLAAVEGEPDSYVWTAQNSQFGVDDWQLDDLDENIALWGSLSRSSGGMQLELQAENDIAESDEPQIFSIEAPDIAGLIGKLPDLANILAEALEAGRVRTLAASYSDIGSPEAAANLLRQVFQWELHLFLALWGHEWHEERVLESLDRLLETARNAGEFGAFVISSAVSRAMSVGIDGLTETLSKQVEAIDASFTQDFTTVILSSALYRAGYTNDAMALLAAKLETFPTSEKLWLALGEFNAQGGQVLEAVDAFQSAMEAGAADTTLYLRYAGLLRLIDTNGWALQAYSLIDPAVVRDNLVIEEMIAAYDAVLVRDPNHAEAQALQLAQLVDVEDKRLWPAFVRLVELDDTGDHVRSTLDAMYHLEDITPALQALQSAVGRSPERADLHLNLALAYLIAEQEDQAITELVTARQLSDDPFLHAEIDRMMLAADDPDFEGTLGEITDKVAAGTSLSSDEVDFLEDAVGQAPSFAEAYLLLARAYRKWDENGAALETLLDGQKNIPTDPDIAEMLAQMLWNEKERELAISYLQKGLAHNPHHVPLLALAGRFLFDEGQFDDAKLYLARAQAISPRSPQLDAVRRYIAGALD